MRLIPLFFLMLAVTLALLAAAAASYNAARGKDEGLLRIDVAIAGDDGDKMTEKALLVVRQMEVVRNLARFHRVSVDEADQKVADGTYDAAIYLNDNMYEDINEGYNTPVTVKLSDKPTLSGQLFRELIECGVTDLQTAESAIYAVYDLSEEYETADAPGTIADRMAKSYIKMFLTRGTVFEGQIVSPYGKMTGLQFAGVSAMLLFTLVLGIGFAAFYGEDERVTGAALARCAVPYGFQSASKLSVMTGISWVFLLILAGGLTFTGLFAEVSFVRPVMLLIPAFGMAAYMHLIYSLMSSRKGSFLYLLITAAMAVAAGGFFPVSFMPHFMGKLSVILPFSGWQSYMSAMIHHALTAADVLRVLFTAAVLIAAAHILQLFRRKEAAL